MLSPVASSTTSATTSIFHVFHDILLYHFLTVLSFSFCPRFVTIPILSTRHLLIIFLISTLPVIRILVILRIVAPIPYFRGCVTALRTGFAIGIRIAIPTRREQITSPSCVYQSEGGALQI